LTALGKETYGLKLEYAEPRRRLIFGEVGSAKTAGGKHLSLISWGGKPHARDGKEALFDHRGQEKKVSSPADPIEAQKKAVVDLLLERVGERGTGQQGRDGLEVLSGTYLFASRAISPEKSISCEGTRL